MKNFNFGIKNFRAFDTNGVTLEVAPITILTGCNSSGKSSFVKAIGLLDSFLQLVRNDIENNKKIKIDQYILDFKSNQNKTLGNFNNVLNNKDLNEITFSYSIYSLILSCDVNVELTFSAEDNIKEEGNNNKKDKLNNGYLKQLVISTDKGVIYSSSKDDILEGPICNLNLFIDKALDFIKQKQLIEEELLEPYTNDNFIFYIPILNKLKDKTADDIKSVVDCFLQELANKGLKEIIELKIKNTTEHIIDDFINSNYNTFGDYYKKKELSFLENANRRYNKAFFESNPTINPDLDIIVDFIYTDRTIEGGSIYFEIIYETFMELETLIGQEPTKSHLYKIKDYDEFHRHSHILYNSLSILFKNLLIECLTPGWSNSIQFVNTGHIHQKRSYSLDEENAFTSSLNKYFKSHRKYISIYNEYINIYTEMRKNGIEYPFFCDRKYEPLSFSNEWLHNFGIADKFNIEQDSEGFGVIKITLEKNEKKMHLADYGLGVTYLVYCFLQIESAILATESAILATEVKKIYQYLFHSTLDKYKELESNFEEQVIAIEEPESHLHPNFQSRLAEMFVEAYQKYNIRFIIETHSEYLIRCTQVLVSENYNSLEKLEDENPFKIHYFQNNPKKPVYEIIPDFVNAYPKNHW